MAWHGIVCTVAMSQKRDDLDSVGREKLTAPTNDMGLSGDDPKPRGLPSLLIGSHLHRWAVARTRQRTTLRLGRAGG